MLGIRLWGWAVGVGVDCMLRWAMFVYCIVIRRSYAWYWSVGVYCGRVLWAWTEMG